MLLQPTLALAQAPSAAELQKMLSTIDERFRFPRDFTRRVYFEQKRRDYPDRVAELVVYRTEADGKMTLIYTKPKVEAGKALLRASGNVWSYDPSVGQWDRRTAREYIQLSNVRARDFDDWNLVKEYDAVYVAKETIGKFPVHHLKLTAKKDVDVGEPVLDFWIDIASGNPLKMETYSSSGRPLRTVLYTAYGQLTNEGKQTYYTRELRILDRVEKENVALIRVIDFDTKPVDQQIFTKAWIEAKSR